MSVWAKSVLRIPIVTLSPTPNTYVLTPFFLFYFTAICVHVAAKYGLSQTFPLIVVCHPHLPPAACLGFLTPVITVSMYRALPRHLHPLHLF